MNEFSLPGGFNQGYGGYGFGGGSREKIFSFNYNNESISSVYF